MRESVCVKKNDNLGGYELSASTEGDVINITQLTLHQTVFNQSSAAAEFLGGIVNAGVLYLISRTST